MISQITMPYVLLWDMKEPTSLFRKTRSYSTLFASLRTDGPNVMLNEELKTQATIRNKTLTYDRKS